MRIKYALLSVIVLMSLTSSYGQFGVVAHWSFDELEGNTFFDESKNSNHGTSFGAQLVEGVIGNALSFNGIKHYARIPGEGENPPAVLKDMGLGSISLWFKVDHIPTTYGIAPIFFYGAENNCNYFDAANQGMIIEVGHSPVHPGSKNLYFTIWKNGCTLPSFCYDSNSDIEIGRWYHFVAVVGEDYNTGFLNGEEMVNRYYNFGNSAYSQFFEDAVVHEKLWLGKGYWDGTEQHFDGAIDELMIFDNPLSEMDVKSLYSRANLTSNDKLPATNENPQITIYPNPVSEKLYYSVEEHSGSPEEIRLLDMTGRVIQTYPRVSKTGNLETSHLNDGLYILEFTGENFRTQKSILVNH